MSTLNFLYLRGVCIRLQSVLVFRKFSTFNVLSNCQMVKSSPLTISSIYQTQLVVTKIKKKQSERRSRGSSCWACRRVKTSLLCFGTLTCFLDSCSWTLGYSRKSPEATGHRIIRNFGLLAGLNFSLGQVFFFFFFFKEMLASCYPLIGS